MADSLELGPDDELAAVEAFELLAEGRNDEAAKIVWQAAHTEDAQRGSEFATLAYDVACGMTLTPAEALMVEAFTSAAKERFAEALALGRRAAELDNREDSEQRILDFIRRMQRQRRGNYATETHRVTLKPAEVAAPVEMDRPKPRLAWDGEWLDAYNAPDVHHPAAPRWIDDNQERNYTAPMQKPALDPNQLEQAARENTARVTAQPEPITSVERDLRPAPRRPLPPLPEGMTWPEDYDKAPEFNKWRGLDAYLRRAWQETGLVKLIDMPTMREHFPAAAEAIDRKRGKLPAELLPPVQRELTDQEAAKYPNRGDRPMRLEWALRSRAQRARRKVRNRENRIGI